jgi:hypothetical protein
LLFDDDGKQQRITNLTDFALDHRQLFKCRELPLGELAVAAALAVPVDKDTIERDRRHRALVRSLVELLERNAGPIFARADLAATQHLIERRAHPPRGLKRRRIDPRRLDPGAVLKSFRRWSIRPRDA